MTGPDRIWAERKTMPGDPAENGYWESRNLYALTMAEYIRRDPAVLAALPEVQAMVAAAYEVRPALTAPRDGTLVRLLLDYSDEENWVPLEDKIQAWTIGYNTLADTGDDEWIIVGWDWSQDCWCEGSGKIIGWLPFVPQAPADATAALAARDAAMRAEGLREAAEQCAKPGTEYERKVAQMKEDFPNGI